MIKRIDLLLPPRSQYGVLHHFTHKLSEAFIRSGVNCRLLQAEYHNPKPFLTQIFQDPPDCTLSFNGLLPDEDGRFFADMIQIPHVACLVDSPNHFFPLIRSKYTVITCVDQFACDFFRGMQFGNVLFMPHAIEKGLLAHLDSPRTYDVVMLGSLTDPESIRKRFQAKYPPLLCKILDEAAEETFNNQLTPYVQAFAHVMGLYQKKEKGIDLQPVEFIHMLDDLEIYIRAKDRLELLKSVKCAKVDLFGVVEEGVDWKKILGDNVKLHGLIPFDDAIEVMKHTKILLNSSPWIKNGGHERIFAGLACGAFVIAAENPFLKESFKEDYSIGYYRYNHWDKVDALVERYLKDDHLRESVVERGREIVMRSHTWDHRAAQLLKELPHLLDAFGKK